MITDSDQEESDAPTISVIMPVYNGERFVGEAIASVIAQTLQPTELIIVDDGSTDASVEVIHSFSANFPIRLLQQKNQRQSAARNLAAAEATGDYLAFIDHDDVWYPKYLSMQVARLQEDARLGWVYCNIDEMSSDGQLVGRNVVPSLNTAVEHPKTNVFNMIAADMFIFPSAAVVRRDAFQESGGFDIRLSGYEDDDLFLRLFRLGWLNSYQPEAFIKYRRHAESSVFTERMWKSREIFAQKLIDQFPDDPELVRYYVRDIIAPRFYRTALAEYYRHYPRGRWSECKKAVAAMRYYHKLMKLPSGRQRLRQATTMAVLAEPRVFSVLYPVLRLIRPMPVFR